MQTAIGLTLTDRCDSTRLVDTNSTDPYGHIVTASSDVLSDQPCRFLPKQARTNHDEYRVAPVFQDAIMLSLSADIGIFDSISAIRNPRGFIHAVDRTVDSVTLREFYKVAYLRGRSPGDVESATTPSTPETPLDPAAPVTPVMPDHSWLGISETDTPSASDFTVEGGDNQTALEIPIGDIPSGERRYIVYAKPHDEGAFTRAYYYQTGSPHTINTFGTQFVEGSGTIDLDGTSHIWIRSRIALRRPSSARTLDAG